MLFFIFILNFIFLVNNKKESKDLIRKEAGKLPAIKALLLLSEEIVFKYNKEFNGKINYMYLK